ncbi:ABC transporter ATP-binding protein [Polyangium spumosum]|uniref:ATP-binding cassette domain-containing protein n=1 Tax=Polyangium spumosum TaxID=889282 RepID=A0A6N7Q5Y9_9BACT|nr:ABC transporter ATP-binding protein [Polyangium spumosum]MRG98095.1 ATP-binding cassette domain-containing protein [Polyangium spumosum]
MNEGRAAEIVAAVGLTKRFGDTVALDDVSFAVEGPGLCAVLGPNGAGKTTLLDILLGLAEPTRGTFRLFGDAPRPYPRRRVGVVMQKEAQIERVTAREYAELFSAIYGVRGGEARILARARLEHRARTAVTRLSGGEAARLFIATAVVHDPALVFLDEPTAHLDPENKRLVGEMLREIAEERTLLMTTHDLREADALADRLLFLVGGRVRASGTKAELARAVPEAERRGLPVEDAFFHFCAIEIHEGQATRRGAAT